MSGPEGPMSEELKRQIKQIPIVVTNAIPPGIVMIVPQAPEPPAISAPVEEWQTYADALVAWRQNAFMITNVGDTNAVEPEAAQALLRAVPEWEGQPTDVQDVPRGDDGNEEPPPDNGLEA